MDFLQAVERMKEGERVILCKEKYEYISLVNLYEMRADDLASCRPNYTIYLREIEIQSNGVTQVGNPRKLTPHDITNVLYKEFVPAESIEYYTEELTNRHKIAMYILNILTQCYGIDMDMDKISIQTIKNIIDMNNNNKQG